MAMLNVFGNPLSATFLFVKSLQKDLGAWSPWGRFLRHRQSLDELLYQEIRDRKTQSEPLGEDILSLLISARDEAGDAMSDVELRDELMTMLFAGHETTATALAWLCIGFTISRKCKINCDKNSVQLMLKMLMRVSGSRASTNPISSANGPTADNMLPQLDE